MAVEKWTFESLKEYVDKIFEERNKAIDSALTATKEAINIAAAAMKEAVKVASENDEKWRQNANEWRGAMEDREERFQQKPEFVALEKAVRVLETKQAIVDSKASTWLVWVGLFFTGASFFFSFIGIMLSVIGTLVTLYVVFLK